MREPGAQRRAAHASPGRSPGSWAQGELSEPGAQRRAAHASPGRSPGSWAQGKLREPGAQRRAAHVREVKANSSRWLRRECVPGFRWQHGYAAFSVSASAVPTLRYYIRNLKEHYRKMSYREEVEFLFRRYGIDNGGRFFSDVDEVNPVLCQKSRHDRTTPQVRDSLVSPSASLRAPLCRPPLRSGLC